MIWDNPIRPHVDTAPAWLEIPGVPDAIASIAGAVVDVFRKAPVVLSQAVREAAATGVHTSSYLRHLRDNRFTLTRPVAVTAEHFSDGVVVSIGEVPVYGLGGTLQEAEYDLAITLVEYLTDLRAEKSLSPDMRANLDAVSALIVAR